MPFLTIIYFSYMIIDNRLCGIKFAFFTYMIMAYMWTYQLSEMTGLTFSEYYVDMTIISCSLFEMYCGCGSHNLFIFITPL